MNTSELFKQFLIRRSSESVFKTNLYVFVNKTTAYVGAVVRVPVFERRTAGYRSRHAFVGTGDAPS